jgi:lipid-binding SYLF domain-containing protein
MKLLKNLLALMLVCMIAFSCKSEKKEGDVTDEAAQEEVSESTDEMTSETTETTLEEDAPEAEAAPEAEGEVESEEIDAPEEPKQITVIFPKDTKLQNEVKAALKEFAKSNPKVEAYLHTAYGFAFFPKITKGGLGIGGAGGAGLVFDDRTVIGESKLAQATFGLQAGGQQYMEIILFEDQPALDRFTAGKVKFSGQASAVALKDGASADVDYQDGVAIFTKTIGGLMAEASVGGQSFKYKPGIN